MARRTKLQIAEELDQIVRILKKGAKRAEELAEIMDVTARYLEKPLKLGKREKRIRTSGAKRWTYYALK